MKLGVPCLVVGIVVTGLLGYPNVKTILEDKANYDLVANTYKQSVDTYKKKEKEYKALNTDNLDVVLESYLDNTAIAEAIANFSGGKLESITAFKGAGSEAVDIIEVSKPSDVAYFTKAIDGMRFSVKYSSLNKFLKSLQNSGISSDNLEIDVNKKRLTFTVDTIFSDNNSSEVKTEAKEASKK